MVQLRPSQVVIVPPTSLVLQTLLSDRMVNLCSSYCTRTVLRYKGSALWNAIIANLLLIKPLELLFHWSSSLLITPYWTHPCMWQTQLCRCTCIPCKYDNQDVNYDEARGCTNRRPTRSPDACRGHNDAGWTRHI